MYLTITSRDSLIRYIPSFSWTCKMGSFSDHLVEIVLYQIVAVVVIIALAMQCGYQIFFGRGLVNNQPFTGVLLNKPENNVSQLFILSTYH